ncbi:MAG: class I SAM-dependent methyltransferase [Bacteroidota bacterium]
MQSKFRYWLFRITSTLRWYRRARTRYDVHSPYLVSFIEEVYRDDRHYHAFDLIANVRRYWRQRDGSVKLMSLGAPSRTTRRDERSVRSLVRTNAIDDASGRLLFRLALWLRAQDLLEFGTNAGISTLYLHAADTRATLDTVEGNPAVANLARETFSKAGTGPGLRPHVDTFRKWLHRQPARQPPLDLFFLDGDHRRQPTLDYVHQLLPRVQDGSVFVIADIHWSEDMESAWASLRQLPEVTASLDLYHFGLLFFKKGLDGPHLTLVPTRFKPWRIGFFG